MQRRNLLIFVARGSFVRAQVEALRRIAPPVFGVLMSLEPAMGAAAGFLFLGQRLSPRDLIAIALVMVASAGATRTAPPQAATDVP